MKDMKLAEIASGNLEMIPTRHGYGDGLVELGRINKNVVVMGADLTSSLCTDRNCRTGYDGHCCRTIPLRQDPFRKHLWRLLHRKSLGSDPYNCCICKTKCKTRLGPWRHFSWTGWSNPSGSRGYCNNKDHPQYDGHIACRLPGNPQGYYRIC